MKSRLPFTKTTFAPFFPTCHRLQDSFCRLKEYLFLISFFSFSFFFYFYFLIFLFIFSFIFPFFPLFPFYFFSFPSLFPFLFFFFIFIFYIFLFLSLFLSLFLFFFPFTFALFFFIYFLFSGVADEELNNKKEQGDSGRFPNDWGNITATWWTEKWGVRGWKGLLFSAFVMIFFFVKDAFEQLSAGGWSQAFILPCSLQCLHKSMQSQNTCNHNSAPGHLFIYCIIVHHYVPSRLYLWKEEAQKGAENEWDNNNFLIYEGLFFFCCFCLVHVFVFCCHCFGLLFLWRRPLSNKSNSLRNLKKCDINPPLFQLKVLHFRLWFLNTFPFTAVSA